MNLLHILTEMEVVASEARPDDSIQGLARVWIDGIDHSLVGWIDKADEVLTTITLAGRVSRTDRLADIPRADFPMHVRTERIFAVRYADREDIK